MVRLDLSAGLAAPDVELDLSAPLPTPTAGLPVAADSSEDDDDSDDDAPAALSTLATRQTELNRERERRDEELRSARERKDARRARDARAKAAKPARPRSPSFVQEQDDDDDGPIASTSAGLPPITRLPSSLFAEASASIAAARAEHERAEKLERDEAAKVERRRQSKRRKIDQTPQEGSSRQLGSVTVQHLADPATAPNDAAETTPSFKTTAFLRNRLMKRTRPLPRGPRSGSSTKKPKKTSALDTPSFLFADAPKASTKRKKSVERERRPAHLVASSAQVKGRKPALAFAASQRR